MIAWVTGAGTGIGRALTETLYREGHQVVMSGRRHDVLLKAAEEIGGGDTARILPLVGDVADSTYVRSAAQMTERRWGPIDLLINNAGVNEHHILDETSTEEFEKTWAVNCLGAFRCIKETLPSMRQRRQGTIVNISSLLGHMPSARSLAYSSSKFALRGLTDSLRQALIGTGVHVMGVYPGLIRTAMTEGQMPKSRLGGQLSATPEKMAEAILQGVRCKRRDVFYPLYVRPILLCHALMPGLLEWLYLKLRKVQ